MAVGELLLPLRGGLGDAPPPRGLDEAHSPAQLLVGDVARPCCLYLADRTERRDRLERVCRYALRPPVAQQRIHLTDEGM